MINFNLSILFACIFFLCNCEQGSSQREDKSISHAKKDTCDDPDANINCCFTNMPATLTSTMVIADEKLAGEKLIISGTIFKEDAKTPFPDVIIYAYHTDSKGYYSKNGTETGFQKWHGRLHGWCKTGSDGKYEINTTRPARYPDNSMPAHIHAAVKTNNGQMFFINDYVFKDDTLVNEKYLSTLGNSGGTGVVDVEKTTGNIWRGKRDIILK